MEVFEAIMRSGSVSAAARELGITQSAVSRILARLEKNLGSELFVRANGRLTATGRAERVLLQTRDILESVAALRAMPSPADPKQHRITFVTVPSLSYGLIPSVLRAFSKERPDVRFGFDVRTTEATVDAMVHSEAEFAIVALPVSHPTLHVTPLFRTTSCVVLHKSHPLASRDQIEPDDLIGEKMIFLLRRQPTRQLVEEAFRRTGCAPDIQVETSNVATACRCASEGLGLAVVNAMMAGYSATPDLVIRPFEPPIHHTVALVEKAGRKRSDDLAWFLECLKSEVQSKFKKLDLPLEILN